jgi:hypothetical protein
MYQRAIQIPTRAALEQMFAEVTDHYVSLHHTSGKRNVFVETMYGFLARVPHLVRVHHSFAVNPDHVVALRRSTTGRDCILTLSTGTEIPVSRTYKQNLPKLPVTVQRAKRGSLTSKQQTANSKALS